MISIGQGRPSGSPSPTTKERAIRRLPLLLLTFLTTLPRVAYGDDPALNWRTFETKHFKTIYPKRYEKSAYRAAAMAEQAHTLLVPLMGHTPKGKTTLVVSSYTDSANGNATVYFRRTIRLFLTSPADVSELSDFDDWLWILILHEYTHILHCRNGSPDRLAGRTRHHLRHVPARPYPCRKTPLSS